MKDKDIFIKNGIIRIVLFQLNIPEKDWNAKYKMQSEKSEKSWE